MKRRPNLQTVLFNGAGVAIVLTVAGYMVTNFFTHETIPACSQFYPAGQQFALQNSAGKMLSPIEMQASVSSREWGLLRNSRVVEAKDRKAHYLQVALEPTESADQGERNGVGFVWQPTKLQGARSACLSYRLFVPKDFAFKGEGYLPGLFAAANLASLDDTENSTAFAARIGWQQKGDMGMAVRMADAPDGRWMAGSRTAWPTGRWLDVQQEVRLNDPDKANGTVRLWVDGALMIEGTKLKLAAKELTGLSGIVSDIHFVRGGEGGGRLTISPFIVQWQ